MKRINWESLAKENQRNYIINFSCSVKLQTFKHSYFTERKERYIILFFSFCHPTNIALLNHNSLILNFTTSIRELTQREGRMLLLLLENQGQTFYIPMRKYESMWIEVKLMTISHLRDLNIYAHKFCSDKWSEDRKSLWIPINVW